MRADELQNRSEAGHPIIVRDGGKERELMLL